MLITQLVYSFPVYFFMLEMLASYGWNSILCFLLDYGLYVMHLSHSNAHDLVFTLVLWMFSLLSSNCSTKTLENPILLYCDYWDCVGLLFCSLRTNSGINIWKEEILLDIGNTLGIFVKVSEQTKHMCYTSYAKICL